VRREEQPWQSRAVVLLDCRASAHHGDGPLSSFEWSVSAAASIGLHLAGAGFTIRLVTDIGEEVTAVDLAAHSMESVLLDVLAVQTASTGTTLQAGTTALRRGGGEELFVAIVGPMTSEDAEQLARAIHGGSSVGVALVLDTTSWTSLSPRAATAAGQAFRDNCDVLRAAGWRVIAVDRGSDLTELWPYAGTGLTAATGREAAFLPHEITSRRVGA
jgi:uncharacterized protein (DUF58 family)